MKEMTPEKPLYYASVSRKILLTFVIVSFLPLMIITGSVLYQFYFFYHEKVEAQLEYLAKLHTQNIDTFLKERLNNIFTEFSVGTMIDAQVENSLDLPCQDFFGKPILGDTVPQHAAQLRHGLKNRYIMPYPP